MDEVIEGFSITLILANTSGRGRAFPAADCG